MASRRRPVSDIYDIVERLAQMWIVAKCQCSLRRTKSESHINCFGLEAWVAEEFNNCVQIAREIEETVNEERQANDEDCSMFAESLDSLQA